MVCYIDRQNRLISKKILETVFSNCSSFNLNESILLGDFNTNWTSSNKCHLVSALKSMCCLFSLKQVINDYTRISSNVFTTIDLILVSDCGNITQCGVIDCCLSDH